MKPIVGENSDSARETAKHAGEAERGGRFEVRRRAYWPLIAQGPPDLLNTGNAGNSTERVFRAYKRFNYKPLPHKPGGRYFVRCDRIGVPFVTDAWDTAIAVTKRG
jgi:hypothetical protein